MHDNTDADCKIYQKSISYCGITDQCKRETTAPQLTLQERSQSLSSSNLCRARRKFSPINLHSLDLCLYELDNEKEKPFTCIMSQESRGRLCFSVAFDIENRCLTVCILEARLCDELNTIPSPITPIPAASWCQSMGFKKTKKKQGLDTRVFMKVHKDDGTCWEQSTKTCKNTLNPVYG